MYEVGQRVGRFVVEDVIKFRNPVIGNKLVYKIKCDCGSEKFISARIDKVSEKSSTVLSKSISCGCVGFDRSRKDLKGRRFGKLTVIKFDRAVKHFLCKCDCGNDCFVDSWELTRDGVDSCEECRAVK
jgi:hypothetical protein